MVDTIQRQLLRASFKGVEFEIRNEAITEAGRRVILHEYPNSDERFVEDIGQIPPKFRLEAFVHGRDFLVRAEALRAALDEEGAGPLVMPVFGNFTANALAYSVDASQNTVGEIKFHLEFATSRRTPGPSRSLPDIEDIFELGDAARTAVQSSLATAATVPGTAYEGRVAEHDVSQLSLILRRVTTGLVVVDQAAKYAEKLDLLDRDRANLVRDGARLSENLVQGDIADPGAWQRLSLGIRESDPEATFDAAQRLLSFGSDLSRQVTDFAEDASRSLTGGESLPLFPIQTGIPLWTADTAQRVQRNQNRTNFVQANRVAALIFFYERAAAADYTTEDQVISIRERLAQGFDAVMRTGFADASSIQSNSAVRQAVDDTRFAALQVLDQKQQVSPGITTVDLAAPRSAVTLSYALYAENLTTPAQLDEQAETINRLNPAQPATAIEGEATILERAT